MDNGTVGDTTVKKKQFVILRSASDLELSHKYSLRFQCKKKKRGKALSKYGTIQRHRKSENSRNQLIVIFKIRIPNKKKLQKHDKNDRRKRFEQ